MTVHNEEFYGAEAELHARVVAEAVAKAKAARVAADEADENARVLEELAWKTRQAHKRFTESRVQHYLGAS